MEDPGLEALKERGSCAETPSSYQQHRHSRSATSTYANVPDISPRLSDHIPTTNRNKMLHKRYSLNLPDQLPEYRIITTAERTERTISKSVADLAWEIAVLEEEVVRKELHLLSLYRAAFDQYLGVSPRASAQVEQESQRQRSRKTADEGTLRLRNIKESAAYNLPTLSDSKRVWIASLPLILFTINLPEKKSPAKDTAVNCLSS
jgi:hypothetical protein